MSHLGAIDRTLLPVDDALTNARRDLLERTVSASSSLYSACSVVSLTRLNHIISRPERDDLNRLMKDQVFVDYFNVFLNLPVSISSCCCLDPVLLRGLPFLAMIFDAMLGQVEITYNSEQVTLYLI